MTTKTPKKGNYSKMREQLFDVEIKPLISSLAAKCQEYNFPMYTAILIDDSEKDKSVANLTNVQIDELPSFMQLCALMTREPEIGRAVSDLVVDAMRLADKFDDLKTEMMAKNKGGDNREPNQ